MRIESSAWMGVTNPRQRRTWVASNANWYKSSRRCLLGFLHGREHAGHRGALPERGVDRHRAAVQLDERAHQREPEAGAAVLRAHRVGLEPVEHLVLRLRRNAGAV